MSKKVLILAALGLGGWWLYRQTKESAGENYFLDITDTVTGAINSAVDSVDNITGGFLKVSRMKTVTAADILNANVQAFLKVIRRGEGTDDANGYRRLFGGGLFTGFADHPRKTIKKSGYTSSAAGAYQILISTWDETKSYMGLTDFSPANQDAAAVGRIAARGALEDVKAGRFETAIKKCAKEWASLPFSPYGQPTISMAVAQSVYTANGGGVA